MPPHDEVRDATSGDPTRSATPPVPQPPPSTGNGDHEVPEKLGCNDGGVPAGSDETLLAELLSLWQRHAECGRPVTAAEVCRDHPELLPELQRRIEAVGRLEGLVRAAAGGLTLTFAQTLPTSSASPATSALQVGAYDVLEELGRGGMGVVYRARHRTLGHEVALKMILVGGHAGQDERARFRLEAAAVARLHHAGLVHIHEFGEHGGGPFFAMEFVPGGSLKDRLAKGPLPFREVATLVETLARAMQHAHDRGIVHRDLKPGNVLFGA
jgi:serine/threonine-protein kinase